jgi:hypothetical protein
MHTITPLKNGEIYIKIDMTDVGVGDFEQFDLQMRSGTLRRHQSELVSGSASSIESVLTNAPGVLAGTPVQLQAEPLDPTGAPPITDRVDVAPESAIRGAPAGAGATRFFFYPGVDAGADNVIRATFTVQRS